MLTNGKGIHVFGPELVGHIENRYLIVLSLKGALWKQGLVGLTVKSQRPILTWMASKRLGEYIIFPFHRNQGHNKAEAREAGLETLVNRILFKTGAAYGLVESSHSASAHIFFSVFFFFFLLRNKFTSVAKKSLELVSCVCVHACGAQLGHSNVEVRGQPRDHLVWLCSPR